MFYSELYIKKKTHLSLLVFLVIPVISISAILILSTQSFRGAKAVKKSISKFEIVNLTSNQAGIFWQTDQKEKGWIVYGEKKNKLDNSEHDERDIKTDKKPYFYHYVLLKNLKSDQTYYFKIINNNQIIEELNGRALFFSTQKFNANESNIKLAYGKLVASNNLPVESAMVLLTVNNSYPLLTLTKSTGEWLIPIKTFIEKDTMNKVYLSTVDRIAIEILNENFGKTEIITNLDNISPLPQTVITGKKYDFSNMQNVLAQTTINNQLIKNNAAIDILFPKNNSIIQGKSPLIKGSAIAGELVAVSLKNSLNSKTIAKQTVKADNNGIWMMTNPLSLSFGDYMLKITTQNEKNKNISLERQFSIAKSGEQVQGEATPEASPTFLPLPTSTPIPITITPTPLVSGFSPNLILVSSSALIIFGLGLLLAF